MAGWVFGIARNRAIDSWRLNARHDRQVSPDAQAVLELRAPGNVQADGIADDARRLREVLARLPDAGCEVIVLAFFGELSLSEIARRLDLPVGTVRAACGWGWGWTGCTST